MQSIAMDPVAGDQQGAVDIEKIGIGVHPTESA
jgi:hypothetical protein